MAATEIPAWMERPTRSVRIAKAIVLALVVFAIVYPFWVVLATSIASDEDLRRTGGLVLFPTEPTLKAYRLILEGGVVTHAVLVSGGVTVIGTALSLLVTIAMAYGLSRPTFAGRPVLWLALLTMLFTPGIIPTYLVVRQLSLLDTYASLILPVLMNAFNLVVMRQFFMGIPQELIDSAKIDGANDLQVLTRIVLPLSKAVIAVVGLFYAVAYWNAFFPALLYLNENSMWPLQLVLRLYVLQGANMPGTVDQFGPGNAPPPEQSVQMAVVMLATVPIMLVYPFLQKYFTAGVLRGAIKG